MKNLTVLFLLLLTLSTVSGCLTPNVRYVRPSMEKAYQPKSASRSEVPAKKTAAATSKSTTKPALSPSFHTETTEDNDDSLDFGGVLIPMSAEDSASRPDIELSGDENDLKKIVEHYMGTPYRSGGTTEDGMDCSGFVWRVYNTLGIPDFPRQSAADIMNKGTKVDLDEAKMGDLVFFRKGGRIYHVGIYMGERRFAHSSSTLGVMYSGLDEEYFQKHFAGLKRIIQ